MNDEVTEEDVDSTDNSTPSPNLGGSAGDFEGVSFDSKPDLESEGYVTGDSFIQQAIVKNTPLSKREYSVGKGYERPPVYEMQAGQVVGYKPPTYAGTTEPAKVSATMAKDILTALDDPLASVIDVPDLPEDEPNIFEKIGSKLGFGGEKKDYVLSPSRTPGMTVEPSKITDENTLVETLIGAGSGMLGKVAFGNPDTAQIQSLRTGEVGAYSDVGGLAGLLSGGPKVSFGEPEDVGPGRDSNSDTMMASIPTNPLRKFYIPQAPSVARFPEAPFARMPSVPYPRAAKGGYIPDRDELSSAIKNKKRGYHVYAMGGNTYGVMPDASAPGTYKTFGGTDEEVRNVFGSAYGYEPTSIDFSKFPGEPGFGNDVITPRLKMKIGGYAGFVGDQPENVSDGDTVADDVPLDVEEGTFIINAAAVEFAGSDDIKKMIREAMVEARRQGIDISTGGAKIPEEEAVSLLVSRGEVVIPPQLAQIIGYDRLEKINNRGKKEVERRQQENGEEQQAPVDRQMAALGGQQDSSGQEKLLSNDGYIFNSVKDIDEEAESIFSSMKSDLDSRMREMDTSGSAEEKIKIRADLTQQILSNYQNQLRALKERSDPYAFQQFQERHTDKVIALQNALDFGEYGSEREKNLAEKASFLTQIPLGADDNKILPGTSLVGFAEPYIGKEGDKVAYIAGKKTEITDPSSTARHETAHLEFKGREKQRLTPIEVDGTTFVLNEEQMLRLIDLDRTKQEGLQGEYDRAMKFLTRGGRNKIRATGLGAYMRLQGHLTQEEIESNLPEIIKQIEEQQKF